MLALEDIVRGDHARGDDLGDTTLDQLIGQLRILELIADSHPLARPHQLRQVSVERMMGEPRQLDMLRRSVGTLGERDAEDLGSLNGIVGKGLVEVAHTKEQDSIGMLLLELHVLPHHRGLGDLFLSHGINSLLGRYSPKSTKKKHTPQFRKSHESPVVGTHGLCVRCVKGYSLVILTGTDAQTERPYIIRHEPCVPTSRYT